MYDFWPWLWWPTPRNYLVLSFDLFAGRVRPSRSMSARSDTTTRLNLMLSLGLLSSLVFFAPVSNVVHRWLSSNLIKWRNCVTLAFTVEGSLAEASSAQAILKACWFVKLPLRPMWGMTIANTKGTFYILMRPREVLLCYQTNSNKTSTMTEMLGKATASFTKPLHA